MKFMPLVFIPTDLDETKLEAERDLQTLRRISSGG
jgi:hypothetical protein